MKKNETGNSNKYYFGSIADRFEQLDNPYDVNQRKNVVFNEFLSGIELKNRLVLDAGCGYGAFSIELAQKKCRLISIDIVQELTKKTVSRTNQSGSVADAMNLPFRDEAFEIVISSEMVEHTPDPTLAVLELVRVLKRNGYLIITTPNRNWQFIVRTASFLHLRNFNGIENFLGYKQCERIFNNSEVEIMRHKGIHLFPFQFKFLRNLSKAIDKKYGEKFLGRFMINQAIFIRKLS
jgi:2-polyprenyl-3-methyl-5-hydroxy-6-metoxy-1,4-benzoquinol methylase